MEKTLTRFIEAFADGTALGAVFLTLGECNFDAGAGDRLGICVGVVVLGWLFAGKGFAGGLLGTVVERPGGFFGGTVAVLGGDVLVGSAAGDFTAGLIGLLWPVSLTGEDGQVMNCVVDKHKQIKIHNYRKKLQTFLKLKML